MNFKFAHICLFLQNRININSTTLLFTTILLLGIFARTWEFGSLPPSLNVDETSIGVEAYSIYHYGIDRNGISFPVHLISWGGGQNALYAYLIIPFIAIWGLNTITVRLPMLISGILTLPIMYYIGKQIHNKDLGLVSMFLLAISPWHIILSRWGLESNILPFIFSIGFVCLLKSKENGRWLVIACLLFALCLYAYGPAYLAIPIFLACVFPILIYFRMNNLKNIGFGLAVFVLIAIPIVLFIIVNTFHLNTIHIGPFTIPRMPARARYECLAVVFNHNPLQSLRTNALILLRLLVVQSDGLLSNVLEPYGYLYTITFPLALTEAIFLIPMNKNLSNKVERLLLLAWLIASFIIGIMQPSNINRINLIFIPLILCVGIFLIKLKDKYKYIFQLAICAFLIGFIGFTHDYHGNDFRKRANVDFNEGFISALDVARQVPNSPICVTETVRPTYIYVLYSEKMNPADYLQTIQWTDYTNPFRETNSLGRYKFGLNNCSNNPKTIYVLSMNEKPPKSNFEYEVRAFNGYQVFLPKIYEQVSQ